jgi:hypothetical protein
MPSTMAVISARMVLFPLGHVMSYAAHRKFRAASVEQPYQILDQ